MTRRCGILRHHPDLRDTAVIVNELGEIGLDHLLVERVEDGVMLLSTGCLCCTMRGDLVNTLEKLLRGLDKAYQSNPVFLQRIAEVLHEYVHDHEASAAAWALLVTRDREGVTTNPRRAPAQLQLGAELEHAGKRERAIDAYTAATALASRDDADDVRGRAYEALKRVDPSRE